MSKIKNGGLDQYGAGLFEQQQFGTAGTEGVNKVIWTAQPAALKQQQLKIRNTAQWKSKIINVMILMANVEVYRAQLRLGKYFYRTTPSWCRATCDNVINAQSNLQK